MKIIIKGLTIVMEADIVTEGEPLSQAQDYLQQINDTLSEDEAGAIILGIDDLNSSDISVTEECNECEEPVGEGDDYFATPCGTFCNACMPKHCQERSGCEICRSEFDL